jgi:murein DD-endopeptidase MepM/ murein hydrolase activator NlpD
VDSTRDRARVDAWQEMDRWQDADPWQESLERSLARRGKSTRSSTGVDRNRARRSTARRLRTKILSAKTIVALAVAAAIVATVLANNGPESAPPPARAAAQRAAAARAPATTRSRDARPAAWRSCPLAVAPAGYVNPLADAIVNPERIDQGVDYAGVGKLMAIGAGRITHLATDNSGWPGSFIEYRLLDGADAGCYVYYAEGVTPTDGLRVGDTVSAGQPIATIIPVYPTGIEIGWGAGIATKAYAKVAGQWSPTDDEDNIASASGKSFSALIAALGGPPGKLEG